MNIFHHFVSHQKVLVILIRLTHCRCVDKLVLPKVTIAESILSRKLGLVMFVNQRLKCILIRQSLDQSETEWLCEDIGGYKIVFMYESPARLFSLLSQCYHTLVSMRMILVVVNANNWGSRCQQRQPRLSDSIASK